jgi:hypothetical protein
MTAAEIVEQISEAGGWLTVTAGGERIRAVLPEDDMALTDSLREHKAEVIRLLRERFCPIHGDRVWRERPTGGYVCGLCHPQPQAEAIQQVQQAEPPSMPQGVRLMEWAPKEPPIAITTWSVVNDVPLFIRSTLAQLEAALQRKHWRAGNWSARALCERLEEAGVKVEITA